MPIDQTQTDPLGSDFAGVLDLSPNLDIVVGRTCLAECLARGLLQDPGSEPDDDTFGLGLGDLIGDDLPDSDAQHLASRAERQCAKDERVSGVSAVAVLAGNGQATLSVQVDTDAGPFTFVLTPTELTVDLLKLKEG